MKKTKWQAVVALIASFALTLCLTACGGGGDEAAGEPSGGTESLDASDAVDPNASEPDEPAALASCEWEGSAGTLSLRIVGAELFTDVNDGDAIRVYYDFYNLAGNIFTTSFASEFDTPSFMQSGEELERAFANIDVPEYRNDVLSVRPGHVIRCIHEYAVSPDAGEVSIALYSYGADEPIISYKFGLANLPGAPTDPAPNMAEADPQWMAGWPVGGVYHDDYDISITSYEFVKGYEGEPILRVFMEFTNNSDEVNSLDGVIYWNRAFQDGIQIEQGIPAASVGADGNYMIDVEPGQTVVAAYCYALSGNSPVEVELLDPWIDGYNSQNADGGIGLVIEVA